MSDSSEPKKKPGRGRGGNSKARVADMLEAIAAVIDENEGADQGPAGQATPQQDEGAQQVRPAPRRRPAPPQGHDGDEPGEGAEKSGEEKDDQPKDGDEAKKPPMPPEKKRRYIIIGVCVGLVLLVAIILFWLYARQFQNTDDAYIDGYVSQISPQASGRVASLLVADNQHVTKGQLLAEIDPRDYQDRLAQAQAQYGQAVAQQGLQRANLGQARANVRVAEADLYQAERDLRRFRSVDPKAVTRQQFHTAVATAQSDRAKLDANRQAVAAAEAQIKAAAATVAQNLASVNNAKLQASYTKITAPIDGKIAQRTVDVGNVVAQGTPLMAVVSGDLWITANFKETQLNHMRIGQKVRIEIDAFPGVDFAGHVDSFQQGTGSVFSSLPAENATGNFVKVVQRIPVKIVFDDPQQRDKYPLAPGMSVEPRVTVR